MRSGSRFWQRARLSLAFAAAKVDSMLFLPPSLESPHPANPSRMIYWRNRALGIAGLTVITLVYVLIILWQR